MTDEKPNMRTLMEAMRAAYPNRDGRSVAAWKAHIIEVMRWKIDRYEDLDITWNDDVSAFGNNGIKAITQLATSGEIMVSYQNLKLRNQPVFGDYGKHTGWGGSSERREVTIQRGPNFPTNV